LVDDEDPVEELAAEGAGHPLADRVRARRLRWRLDDLDGRSGEDGVGGDLRGRATMAAVRVLDRGIGELLAERGTDVDRLAGWRARADGRSRRAAGFAGRRSLPGAGIASLRPPFG